MTAATQSKTILIVDDERDYLDAYDTWLSGRYEVRTALGGDAALEAVDDTIDVILLDRRMPDRSGAEVLETIRDRGFDVRVAMVTAVEPDLDIVDLPFDEYVVKPVDERDLVETVESLLARQSFDDQLQECFSLVAKRAALETSMDRDELDNADEYQELQERIKTLEERTAEQLDDLITRGVVDRAYADIES